MKSPEELKKLDKYITTNPMYGVLKSLSELANFQVPTTYRIPTDKFDFWILASVDGGWEHVSVSLLCRGSMTPLGRLPRWLEMQQVKEMFWSDDECVIQFHPAKEDYVNRNPNVLHLWKLVDKKFPVPPKDFV